MRIVDQQVSFFRCDSLKERTENKREGWSLIRIMIHPYLVFQDRIHKAINSRVWKIFGTDFRSRA